MRRRAAVASALLGGLLAAGLAAAQPAAPSAPTECRIAGLRHAVLCGKVSRPLDPARPDGTRIDVHYVVVPALARRKFADPVFLLAGGPGQSAIDLAPSVMPLFGRLNNRRDMVFVDQRGTGRSAPLDCGDPRGEPLAEQADPARQSARLFDCLARLQRLPHGDLRKYTTSIAVQDLDAVRAALGAAQVNLIGASYGTRVALEYQRQFPAAVRRSVLDGVAPPDMDLVASLAVDSRRALEAVFTACEADAGCRSRYPALRADWQALLASLPREVTVDHPLTGAPERVILTRTMLLGIVRGPLYAPALAAALPAAMAAAAKGDFRGLMGAGSLLPSRRGSRLAMGMHLSVVCAEDRASIDRAPVPGAATDGDGADALYREICSAWPRGDVSAGFYRIGVTSTPVLLLSGGLDPATPPRHAERVANALGGRARHVVVPNAGHGVMGLACLRDAIFRFIDAADEADALAVDTGCAQTLPRPPAFRPIEGVAP
ncbi:MAG: alpha/beta hydrolase [Burkholderiaceae bacterium]